MKKIAAILLTGILFFNWYGYRLVSCWLEERADRQLEARLDVDSYDESQLILIKVPSTHLSYYNSSTEFERVDGEIEMGGIQYKYVKRRLFNDSLELLCIPNHAANRLTAARNEFFQQVNDLQQHNGQGKKANTHPGSSKNFTTDYYTPADNVLVGDLYAVRLPHYPDPEPAILISYHTTAEQPPDGFFA